MAFKPVIPDPGSPSFIVAPDDSKMDARHIPISSVGNNVQRIEADGIAVIPADLVDTSSGNQLVVTNTGKLRVAGDADLDLISKDPGNQLGLGTDRKLNVPPADPWDFVSNDANNAIVRGGDNKPFVEKVTAVSIRSTDMDNDLTIGTDGGLKGKHTDILGWLTSNREQLINLVLSQCAGNVLEAGCDGGIYAQCCEDLKVDPNDDILSVGAGNILASTVRLGYNNATNVISLTGKNGKVIDTYELNTGASSVLESVQIVTDPSGQPAGTYIEFVFTTESGTETVYLNVTDLIDIVTAGNAAIRVTDQAVFLVVDATQEVLYIDPANGLSINVSNLNSTDAANSIVVSGGRLSYQVTTDNRALAIRKVATGQNITLTLYDQVATGGNPLALNGDSSVNGIGVNKTLLVQNIPTNLIRPNAQGVTLIASDVISTDVGNIIRAGNDGKIFAEEGEAYTSGNVALNINGRVLTVSLDTTVTRNPVVITGSGATGGLSINKAYLVSTDSDNLISENVTGVKLTSSDVRSAATGNLITAETDGLSVTGANLISTDSSNAASAGTDGKIFVPEQTSVSGLFLCEFYFFRNPTIRRGFVPAVGLMLADAATNYPEAWAYLQTSEGEQLCITEEQWQTMSNAPYATLTNGTQLTWGGVGGVPYFAPNFNTGALHLPDVRGMYMEASGFDSLTAGGVHGDGMRRLSGTISSGNSYVFQYAGGVFSQSVPGNIIPTGPVANPQYGNVTLDSRNQAPSANKVQPRAFGVLACVYMGGI